MSTVYAPIQSSTIYHTTSRAKAGVEILLLFDFHVANMSVDVRALATRISLSTASRLFNIPGQTPQRMLRVLVRA